MGYVSSSSPLPVNSSVPGPPAVDDNAVAQDRYASMTGRERVYANTPEAASLWCEGPGLAVDANQILGQSELARQSVLNGMGWPAAVASPSLAQILASAPVVSSLNGSPGSGAGLDTTQSGLMPAPAPVQTVGGLWGSPKVLGAPDQRGTVSARRRPGSSFRFTPVLGPGCAPMPESPAGRYVFPAMPPASDNPQSPVSIPTRMGIVHLMRTPTAQYPDHVTASDAPPPIGPVVEFETLGEAQQFFASQGYDTGLSGWSPSWGDAWAAGGDMPGMAPASSSNNNAWLWVLGGMAALGLASSMRKRRR